MSELAKLSNTHLGVVVNDAYNTSGAPVVPTDMSKNPVLVPFLTDCIETYTKTRLDEVETALDTLLTALTTMAATFTATGIAPVTGAALGAALTALVTAASANQAQRVIDKNTQTALPTPYFDGVK
jgi:hypothetical protein